MRTTVSIQGKEYRVAITPQTFVYFAKAIGKSQVSLLQDSEALTKTFENMDMAMMEMLFFAALKAGAYKDHKQLDLTKEQAAEAYYFEDGLMEEFSELLEAQMGGEGEGEKKPMKG